MAVQTRRHLLWKQLHCLMFTNQKCYNAGLYKLIMVPIFSTRCNIYISHLCYDVSVHLSVCLSVTFVHCGHRVQWIPDIFACLDRWMSLLLLTSHPDRRMGWCRDFWWKRGDTKIGNCSNITYFTYWESGPETRDSFVYQRCWQYNRSCWSVFISNLGRKCIISEEQFMIELLTSRAMLATARPSCTSLITVLVILLDNHSQMLDN